MSENTDVNDDQPAGSSGGFRRSRRSMRRAERAAEREAYITGQQPLLTRRELKRLREEAEALRGARLLVDAHPEEDAWYPHELKGLEARTPSDDVLGTVSGLTPGAAQDLLLVATDRGTVMVPFVTALVPTVDVEGGVVIIDAPPGLFDDEAVSEREDH